jgi:glycine/D-amino acid oxidase-like deaminating enzyme
MEETDVLIVGQGLAGTWLSWWLHQSGLRFKVLDQSDPGSASNRAAGLINPVTGRRLVTTWMIDELMPFSFEAYLDIGKFLGESFIDQTKLVDFFPSVQMLQAFQKRFAEDPSYLQPEDDREKYADCFRYELGWGAIQPCGLVSVVKFLTAWRRWLEKKNLLIESVFDLSALHQKHGGVEYSGIHTRYIVFCDGKSSVQNPYFEKLPFALNKGEGLLVEIRGLPAGLVFKKGMSLVPYGENIYWLGSSYEWEFNDDQPSEKFRQSAVNWLGNFLKLPFTVLEHFSALRPATLERRPFAGFHPLHPQIGILNGLGTKGCSLAPYFARQLADSITVEGTLNPMVDIKRFKRLLGG